MRSLRQQILWPVLASVLSSGAFGTGMTYWLIDDEVEELCDSQLRGISAAVGGESNAAIRLEQYDPEIDDDFTIQVWEGDRLSFHAKLLVAPEPERAISDGEGVASIQTLRSPQGDWRSIVHVIGDRKIQVAQPVAARRRMALALASRSLVSLLGLLPFLGLFIWIIVTRRLAPVRRLGQALQARDERRLGALDSADMPRELVPTVLALNELLARLRTALAAQHAFVADAAHALRTPLAAVSLQVQEAETADLPEDRAIALAALRSGVDRATHLVEQLLTLARLEPGASPAPEAFSSVAMDRLVREAIADHFPLARIRGLELGCTAPQEPIAIAGDPAALRTLIDVLLDNAIRYVPSSGRIDVVLRNDMQAVELEIADTGPGIPAAERSRVLDRFYRGNSSSVASGENGNGLGLSIAAAIARQHRAELSLHEGPEGRGLCVRLRLAVSRAPLASAPKYVP